MRIGAADWTGLVAVIVLVVLMRAVASSFALACCWLLALCLRVSEFGNGKVELEMSYISFYI